MLAINFADDQVNPAQFGATREMVARLPSGQLAMLPGGYGHLGIFHAELWADQLGSFLESPAGEGSCRPVTLALAFIRGSGRVGSSGVSQ
jgi:hypothetical protein